MFHVLGLYGETNAYEKDGLKCLVSWFESSSGDTDINFEINCTSIDEKTIADFKDIYPTFEDYNPPIGYSKFEKVDTFCITKKNDNFAKGWVGQESSSTWYARKKDGKWIMELITQDYPLCDSVEGFPADYLNGKCLLIDDNNVEVQIRNFVQEQEN